MLNGWPMIRSCGPLSSRNGLDRKAASTSQMGRFETEWLATEDNLKALADLYGAWIDRVHDRKPPDGIIFDMDSSVSPTYGAQEGTAYNGHFACNCYHPLFLFNQLGGLERSPSAPRQCPQCGGLAAWSSSQSSRRYRQRGIDLYFRADAAFAKPELYERLEAEEHPLCHSGYRPTGFCRNALRTLLTRLSRASTEQAAGLLSPASSYQAQSWSKPRRVVAKVAWHQGELYPRVGFIVTNPTRPNRPGGKILQRARDGGAIDHGRQATPFAGRGCPAEPSSTTPCGCNCMLWPTISPTSCVPSPYPSRSSIGR